MRRAPDRPWPLQILILFAGFLAGPLASLRLSMELAPGSELVQTVSGFLFALAFVAASLAWTGVGFVSAAFSTIRQLVRSGRITPVTAQPGERLVPAGYGAYVLFSTAAGFVIGLLAGVATELRLAPAVLAWTALGAAYGIALWAAAHHGFLPFLEPE